jgi:hypothetical protein
MQRKLTLDVDTLQVASFEAGMAPDALRGTVEGREEKRMCAWSYITSCPGTPHLRLVRLQLPAEGGAIL